MKPKTRKPSPLPSSGSDYHRHCHLAYTPIIRIPKPITTTQNKEPAEKVKHEKDEQDCSFCKQNRNEQETPQPKNKRTRKKHHETDHKKNDRELQKFEAEYERNFQEHPIREADREIKLNENIGDFPLCKSSERIVEYYINENCSPNIMELDENKALYTIKKINFCIPDEVPAPEKKSVQSTEPVNVATAKTEVMPVAMDWNNYHRLNVIHAFMDKLEFDFPSLCTTAIVGTSVEGRNLKILKISNSDANNACVWVDAGIHAREWIAPAVNTYIANHITRNFETLPDYIKNKDWYFLPVVNPDGYEFSHTTERLWRKNRRCIGDQCVGVDLNRNFSYGWGGHGSSDQPTNAFYRGPEPFSEPESAAMRDVLLHSGLNFKVYITLHSFGQVIIFPYACSSELAPDYVRLLEGATVMSKAINKTNGNTYKVGISRDVMYGAAGTSNDFAHAVAGIPFCYLIELRSKKHKFKLPKEEIEETGNEILNCVKALMEFVDKHAINKISGGSDKTGERSVESLFLKKTDSRSHPRARKSKCNAFVDSEDCDDYEEEDETSRSFADSDDDDDDNANVNWSHSNGKWIDQSEKTYSPKKKITCNATTDPINKVKVAPTTSNIFSTQIWEVKFSREGQRHFVKVLDTIGAINIWKEERSTMDIMIEGPRTAQIAGMLREREIPYSVAVPDINTLLEKEQGNFLSRRKHSSFQRTMDWDNYHRLDTIYAFLDNLAIQFPHLCKVSVIGKSVEGRDLKMLKISNGVESNNGVWLDGAIHPREWISPAVVTFLANQIVRNFNDLPESITNKDWYVLPVMNPDGYEYTHTHDRMWRKNRARYGECIGVDLNRNFSYGFGEKGEEGSSEDPGNIFYRGPKAFSEPETAAVRRVIVNSPKTFKVFLSFHSYGEVIIFPWGYTSEPCPDYVELLEGGTAMAKAIYNTNGHTYKVGSTKDLMYYASGTSIDWSYAVTNIQYSYMVELRGKTHRFLLPKEEIVTTATEVVNGVFRLMDFVDRRCAGSGSCVCPK